MTTQQISNMKHALGYDVSMVKQGKYTPYRNYFACSNPDESWEDLVKDGYADKSERFGDIVYFVSDKGRSELSQILGIDIL